MKPAVICLVAVLLPMSSSGGHGARILGIFPSTALSHQLPFQAVMKALAARGHEITVISPNPLKKKVANYTDIDLSVSYEHWRNMMNLNNMHEIEPLAAARIYHDVYTKIIDLQLNTPQMQAFMKSNPKFDLVITERFFFPAYSGLTYHVGSPPVVSIISFVGLSPAYTAVGNPLNPAFVPDVMHRYSDRMSFWERLHNTYLFVVYHYMWYWDLIPKHEVLMRKHFGSGPPSVYHSDFNDSLMIVNNHWSLSYSKPLFPNVVEVTGLHIKTTIDPLRKDIKDFLDGATDGVIYFCLGSAVRSELLPQKKLMHILEVFSQLPQRILWKWESDSMPGKPDNVMLEKWMPQQEILAHPNIRAFITQGGLQSFQEAAYYGIPLIGMPFLGDQFYNVGKFVSAKIGVRLLLKDLTKETFLDALTKVLNDSTYRENMSRFAASYKEQVGPSLGRAVWWIEYVLRHNGAHHLRPATLDLTWYQYLLLDVIAVTLIALSVVLCVAYCVVKKVISFAM